MHKHRLILFLLLYSRFASGQFFQNPVYPQNEFRNPLGIPIKLAANFGELRANHYHMGLDIRTEHRENLPVYASADGYIYRIKIEPFGFGQAIYIRHPNGFVTLYAHLNAFYPALAAYIKQKQYELERWDLSLEPPAGLFTVKKGDLIAISGNRGGSQGPHLHFEIRTLTGPVNSETNLNPMLFGLPILDKVPPVIRSLSVYDRGKSFYEQRPVFIPVRKTVHGYVLAIPELIMRTPHPGFGIQGYDTQSDSKNPNGIFQAVMYDNGTALSGFQMNRISYDETRGINAHIDYPTHERGGPYYQLLFKMPGYNHSIYRESTTGGMLDLEDKKLHEIRIEVKDAYGNISNLQFSVRYEPGEKIKSGFPGKVFYPGMLDGFESPEAAFYLGPNCLYDSLHVGYLETVMEGVDVVSGIHQIGTAQTPLADTMTVRIKLLKPVNKDRVLMEWANAEDAEVKKPEWLGEWATGSFRSFGIFLLALDTVAPLIRFPGITENANLQKSSRIAVVVTDNYRKIKNFRGTIDGKWVLFTNDKAQAFIYDFDEHCPRGNHELKIYAEDEAGNGASATIHFTR